MAVRRWRHLFVRFGAEDHGVVLVLVVLVLVPLMLVMAGVIDYSRSFLVKRQLTNAVDSAALALGVLPGLSDDDADAKAQAFIQTHFTADGIGTLGPVDVTREGETINVSATATVDMTFLRMAGIDTIDITVDATAIRKENKLEVALVLDTTGSMSGTKIQNLRTAARGFVDILFSQDDAAEYVKVGLVPFAAAVRVNVPSDTWWLDTSGASSVHGENLDLGGKTLFELYEDIGETWEGCLRARPAPYDTTDAAPNDGNPHTLWVPFFAPDEPDSGGYSNSYLVDDPRNELPDDMTAEAMQRDITKYTSPDWRTTSGGPEDLCADRPILPLTNNPDTLRTQINLLNADGNTVIPAGLAWGWRLVSPGEPFTAAEYTDQKVIKAIVLLTDGSNIVSQGSNGHNESRFSAYGYAGQPVPPGSTTGNLGPTSGSGAHYALDKKLVDFPDDGDDTPGLCDNIKADMDDDTSDQDIIIFTISFQANTYIQGIMEDCATDANKSYKSNDDLTKVFEQIAVGLNQLRLME